MLREAVTVMEFESSCPNAREVEMTNASVRRFGIAEVYSYATCVISRSYCGGKTLNFTTIVHVDGTGGETSKNGETVAVPKAIIFVLKSPTLSNTIGS